MMDLDTLFDIKLKLDKADVPLSVRQAALDRRDLANVCLLLWMDSPPDNSYQETLIRCLHALAIGDDEAVEQYAPREVFGLRIHYTGE